MKPIKIAFGSAALLLMLSAGTAVNAAGLKQGQKAPARTTEAVSTRTVQSSKKQAAAKPTQHKGYPKPAAQAQPAQPKAKQASSQAKQPVHQPSQRQYAAKAVQRKIGHGKKKQIKRFRVVKKASKVRRTRKVKKIRKPRLKTKRVKKVAVSKRTSSQTKRLNAQVKAQKQQVSRLQAKVNQAQSQVNASQKQVNNNQAQVKSKTDTANKFQKGLNDVNAAQSRMQAAVNANKQAQSKLQDTQNYIAQAQRIYIPQGYNWDLLNNYNSTGSQSLRDQLFKLGTQGANDSRNTFIASTADQQIKADPKNLTADQQKELATYAVRLINDARDQFGSKQHLILNNSALSFAKAVANEYQQNNQDLEEKSNDKWNGHYGPGITRAAKQFGLYTDDDQDNFYENAGEEWGSSITNMADLKRRVYEDLSNMIFGNVKGGESGSEWLHASSILGTSDYENPAYKAYFGLSTSTKNDGELDHFIIVKGDYIPAGSRFNVNDYIDVQNLTSLADQNTLNSKRAELPNDQQDAATTENSASIAQEDYEYAVMGTYQELLPDYDTGDSTSIDYLKQQAANKQTDLNNAKNALTNSQVALASAQNNLGQQKAQLAQGQARLKKLTASLNKSKKPAKKVKKTKKRAKSKRKARRVRRTSHKRKVRKTSRRKSAKKTVKKYTRKHIAKRHVRTSK